MREQLRLAGPPRPEVIGVAGISIRKGHTYRIVVSDLEKRRAIWFGGEGRRCADMDRFHADLGEEAAKKIRLAVHLISSLWPPANRSFAAPPLMDMWKPFRKSARQHARAKRPLSSTSSISRAIYRMHSIACAGRNTSASRAMNAPSSRGSAMFCSPAVRTSATADARTSNACCRPTRAANVAYLLREQFEQLWELHRSRRRPLVLRQLAAAIAGTGPRPLRKVRPHDRKALGRHRRLLQA